MSVAVLIVAGGTGQRAGGGAIPKQYQALGDRTVIAQTVQAFIESKITERIQIVIHKDHQKLYEESFSNVPDCLLPPVYGGSSRQASVLAGLKELAKHKPDYVLIHDAARPFVNAHLIKQTVHILKSTKLADGTTTCQAVLVAVPVTDTIKEVHNNKISKTIDRSVLMAAQTPQAFSFDLILSLHQQAAKLPEREFTDDISLAEWQDIPVCIQEGSPENIKITSRQDLLYAQHIWSEEK